MTKEELYWLAGFYEGEGCCGTYMQKDNRRSNYAYKKIEVNITQKDRRILDWIQKKVGYGSICKKSKDGCHGWSCASLQARTFIVAILPYMRTKHKRAQIHRVINKYGRRKFYGTK